MTLKQGYVEGTPSPSPLQPIRTMTETNVSGMELEFLGKILEDNRVGLPSATPLLVEHTFGVLLVLIFFSAGISKHSD